MFLSHQIKTFIDGQYRCPTGLVGRVVGARMVRQHGPETDWTLALLELQATDYVLEIGFGAGKAIESAAEKTTQGFVAGIDLSPTMVQTASRRNTQKIKAGRVDVRQGDVVALPFGDEQFDKIMSIQTFYFWSDLPRTIAEISRVLKPGGKLVLTLSTGTVGQAGTRELWPFQATLEEQVIPGMIQAGFTTANLKQGPDSRQFMTIAVIGVK